LHNCGAGGAVHRVFLQSGLNCLCPSPGSGRREVGGLFCGVVRRRARQRVASFTCAFPVRLLSAEGATVVLGARRAERLGALVKELTGRGGPDRRVGPDLQHRPPAQRGPVPHPVGLLPGRSHRSTCGPADQAPDGPAPSPRGLGGVLRCGPPRSLSAPWRHSLISRAVCLEGSWAEQNSLAPLGRTRRGRALFGFRCVTLCE